GDTGMRAVASVIMNRVQQMQGEYGRDNTGSDVACAPRQFECATDQPQNLYNMSPEGIHFDIAQWALSGGRLAETADSLWFFNPYSETCRANFPNQNGYFKTRIGNHCFYSPTSSYFST
ncbi:MAG: cell wall hydrolase, partial [Clostridiales bacterium]|nr:cell wall hydrolase [Clostridiales bacterium]